MKRQVYAIFSKCNPIKSAISIGNGKYQLEVDLKNAFHQGYIDLYNADPPPGENPIMHELIPWILDTNELRFKAQGLGTDKDNKIQQIARLGRCLARGVLNQHFGYTWFSHIQNLLSSPDQGWAVQKIADGDTPDWLVGGSNFALAEAKGTTATLTEKSSIVKKARSQFTTISIFKNNKPVNLKSWIIANKFVTDTKRSDQPICLIEDPDSVDLSKDDQHSLIRWIAKNHILNNLRRLYHYRLMLRITEKKMPKVSVLIWRCLLPQLSHIEFVGRIIPCVPVNWPWHVLCSNALRPAETLFPFYQSSFFDGMCINPIQELINGKVPQALDKRDYNLAPFPYISLLSDGSLVVPLDIMEQKKSVEI